MIINFVLSYKYSIDLDFFAFFELLSYNCFEQLGRSKRLDIEIFFRGSIDIPQLFRQPSNFLILWNNLMNRFIKDLELFIP